MLCKNQWDENTPSYPPYSIELLDGSCPIQLWLKDPKLEQYHIGFKNGRNTYLRATIFLPKKHQLLVEWLAYPIEFWFSNQRDSRRYLPWITIPKRHQNTRNFGAFRIQTHCVTMVTQHRSRCNFRKRNSCWFVQSQRWAFCFWIRLLLRNNICTKFSMGYRAASWYLSEYCELQTIHLWCRDAFRGRVKVLIYPITPDPINSSLRYQAANCPAAMADCGSVNTK